KIVVIRNGLIPSADTPRDSTRAGLCFELGVDEASTLVGVLARLEPVKGHHYLIEAAARVVTAHPKAHFVLIGEGALKAEIESQAARLGLADRIHLLGHRAEGARLIAACDLAVLPSLHEGLPNAVIEAMAAGVPVVATAVGGTAELITD